MIKISTTHTFETTLAVEPWTGRQIEITLIATPDGPCVQEAWWINSGGMARVQSHEWAQSTPDGTPLLHHLTDLGYEEVLG